MGGERKCKTDLDIWIVAWSWLDHSDSFRDVEPDDDGHDRSEKLEV
jgi:hypothetical protein